MNKVHDGADAYRFMVHGGILKLAPITAISAALTFTIARLCGAFINVDIVSLICFDIICFSYFIPAFILSKVGVLKDGKVYDKYVIRTGLILDALVILQWNLITYIFPNNSFWGFAPMFVLLTAFMFKTSIVLVEIAGLSVSIALSWLLIGEKLLPYGQVDFQENLILRIVALAVSFLVILLITFCAEKFTKKVKQDYVELDKKNQELDKMSKDVLDFSAEIIEQRDITSGLHVKRIKRYTKILATTVMNMYPEYNLTHEKVEAISLASGLHDMGKIFIPDSILLKPAKLTPEEFEKIKTHTTVGARMIDKLPDSVDSAYKSLCKEICLFHHERYDGNGYPTGLVGDEIPISAQIVAVVDCYDALINERPYKNALPKEKAIYMILNDECGVFSDKMKKAIKACVEELYLN